ncbi:uncharacterized protein SCHCODRAFT_02191674 [Schizophyllum commune H4-8]|uniref:uncharacterized protein n=1 Tax=Schizophyllum commune (strain H4-8 / FGSC 9210) TaxID=578458 RepID=UPI00215F917D|nr:uncharacterized protein SCHCODRAFT_02191674 [Schizophyllum commune H4-8]KAI5896459.1 hypothetical protein SCHCODRAFT_02191674 [Schizophyllum commune H4-8]
MASALMQRRALRMNQPLLGLTFSPGQWTINALYGWFTPALDHDCVQLKVAHAPLDSRPNRHLGVLDISDMSSARLLAYALSSSAEEFVSGLVDVQARVLSIRQTLMHPRYPTWRLDLMRWHDTDPENLQGARESIRKWSEQCSGRSSVSPTCPTPPIAHVSEDERLLLRGLSLEHLVWQLSQCDEYLVEHLQLAQENSDSQRRESMRLRAHEILVENKVQFRVWPLHSVPQDPQVTRMFHGILDDLVWPSVAYGSSDENRTLELTTREKHILAQFEQEMDYERSMRATLSLPGLIHPYGHFCSSITRLVHCVQSICERARHVNDVSCARAPWLSLVLALCGDEQSTAPDVWHIRSCPGIPLARDVYLDSAATADFPDREDIADAHADIAAARRTGCNWATKKENLLLGCPPDAWLEDHADKISKVVLSTCIRRQKKTYAWGGRAGREQSCHVHARVLNDPHLGACDTIAFVSVAGVFGVPATADPSILQKIADFRIIGPQLRPRNPGPCLEEEDEDVDAEARLPHILDEVRRRLGINPDPGSSVSSPSPSAAELFPSSTTRSLHDPHDASVDPSKEICLSNIHDTLELPIISFDDRAFHGSLTRAYDCARLRLQSMTRFYAIIGIYDLPVFALVSSGRTGILLCAWGSKPSETTEHTDVITNIADTNCPRWDIGDPSQALRFHAFISRLREVHTPKVLEAFEGRRQEFVQAWKADPDAPRFRWTMKHQQEEPIVQALPARLEAEQEELLEWQERVDLIEALIAERVHLGEEAAPTRPAPDWTIPKPEAVDPYDLSDLV